MYTQREIHRGPDNQPTSQEKENLEKSGLFLCFSDLICHDAEVLSSDMDTVSLPKYYCEKRYLDRNTKIDTKRHLKS